MIPFHVSFSVSHCRSMHFAILQANLVICRVKLSFYFTLKHFWAQSIYRKQICFGFLFLLQNDCRPKSSTHIFLDSHLDKSEAFKSKVMSSIPTGIKSFFQFNCFFFIFTLKPFWAIINLQQDRLTTCFKDLWNEFLGFIQKV